MLARVHSGAVIGVDALPVDIEVNVGGGELLAAVIVGLPDAAVKESKDRVFTAMINSGFDLPEGRTTINLAPADTKKEGPSFDLPIALATLAATGQIDRDRLKRFCVLGELALSGRVRRVRGVLPIALSARSIKDCDGILVPTENGEEAAVVEGLQVFPTPNLRAAADFINGQRPIEPLQVNGAAAFAATAAPEEDFADVKGQEYAKRAIEVAVAGGHNLMMIGPPGTGKTMLARRIPGILPPLTLEEALEATKIHSIAGTLPPHQALIAGRSFRSPHHTVSDAGLLGGGAHPLPGEVSLAHHGVLFLDELPEFHRNVLEVLRQPLEDGRVTIARAAATVTFPCHFMLVAAMNPCPCGFHGDPRRECRCSPPQIQRYRNRVSGPLLDRIDLHVEVPAVPWRDLASAHRGEGSDSIRARVLAAREGQRARFKGLRSVHCNADMRPRDVARHAILQDEAAELLKRAISELHFSARAYDRILKVARTIADLEGSETIGPACVSEAVQYRSLDRQLWT